jgi:hypothetical protein
MTRMVIQAKLLTFILLWAGHVSVAQPRPGIFVVNDTFTESTLNGYLSIYSSSDKNQSFSNMLKISAKQHCFKPIHDEILNLGFDPRYHWIKCQIRNQGSQLQNLVFGIDYFHIDTISFYAVDTTNTIVYKQENLNRKTTVADRPIAVRSFAFPVVIKPRQSLTLYCCIFRQKSVLILPIKLFTKKTFLDSGFSFDFLFLLGAGVMLIAFLTSFALFLVTQKRVLLYYSGHVFSFIVLCLSLKGVWGQYVTNFPFMDENTHLVMIGTSIFFQLYFTIEFLHLTDSIAKKWLNGIKLYGILALLASVYVLVMPFTYTNVLMMSDMSLITEVIILGLIK